MQRSALQLIVKRLLEAAVQGVIEAEKARERAISPKEEMIARVL